MPPSNWRMTTIGLFALALVSCRSESGWAQAVVDRPLAASTEAAADRFPAGPLPPMQRIVLYHSGVAHLQHTGPISGNQRLSLEFSRHDVDDVLKSLVFSDRAGTVRAVEYQPAPNAEAIAAQTVGQPLTLAQLLQRYRGESVTLNWHGDGGQAVTLSGRIFGVENRSQGDATTEFLVLMTPTGLRATPLDKFESVRFDNEAVEKELQQALTGVVNGRQADRKRLELLCAGTGERTISFAYVLDAPIWRMTYRLAVDGEQLLLHGWAHVNNVSGLDWNAVELELRNGRPQAFHADLFAPVVAERPSLGLNVFGLPYGLNLVQQWFGFEPKRFGDEPDAPGEARRGSGMGGMMGGMGGGGMGFGDMPIGGDPTAGAATEAGDVAGPFDPAQGFTPLASLDRAAQQVRLKLTDPVTLAAGKSSALPVFSQIVTGRKISLVHPGEPGTALSVVSGIEFSNDTGHPLLAGPVSVSEAGDFVGDAQLAHLPLQGTTRLVYADDLPLKATRRRGELRTILADVAIQRQQLVVSSRHEQDEIYELNNQDDRARVVLIEATIPQTESGEAFTSPAPSHRDEQRAYYETAVSGLTSTNYIITTSSSHQSTVAVADATVEMIDGWLSQGESLPAATRERLSELRNRQQQLTSLRKEEATLSARRASILAEQSRIRENLKVLAANSTASEPYLKQLQENEEELKALTANQARITQQIDAISAAVLAK